MPRTTPTASAQKATLQLVAWGMRPEEIAYRLRVSMNTVIRWRKGVVPQPGHLRSLLDLMESERRRRDKAA